MKNYLRFNMNRDSLKYPLETGCWTMAAGVIMKEGVVQQLQVNVNKDLAK